MGRLNRIELENFKSYKGHQTIGPFKDLTCVIGPNGVGKSNLMDAISFVLGVKSAQLRSSQLRELIYRDRTDDSEELNSSSSIRAGTSSAAASAAKRNGGAKASTESSDPRKAWVMAAYLEDDGNETRFLRSVNMAGVSEYQINGKVMLYTDYDKELKNKNILVKARNFLVFQGDVEAIASQSSKELTNLIEQISGSLDLKAQYDRLQAEQERAVENSTFNYQKKKGINAEMKQYQEQQAEAKRFETLQTEKANLTVMYLLWKLFHIEDNIKTAEADIVKKQQSLATVQAQAETIEEQLKETKREQAVAQRDAFRKEQALKRKQKALEAMRPEAVGLNEKVEYMLTKLKATQGNETNLQETNTSQKQSVAVLKSQVTQVEKALARFKENAKTNSSHEVTLSGQDLVEYSSKKEEFALQTMSQVQNITNLTRELKGDLGENTRLQETVQELSSKQSKLDEQEKQLVGHQRKVESHLAKLLQDQAKAQHDLTTLKTDRAKIELAEMDLNDRLSSVMNKLMEAKVDQRESEKEQKLKETLAALRRVFPGVYGRITDLCKPTLRRYDAAIGVILGRHLDSIVVDTEATGRECIRFLREQRAGEATFLPLDTLVTKPVNDRLRSLHKGARLAVDVIQYDNVIDRAVQYACGGALVCDTREIAEHICYELGQQVKAVALDGTVYHKSGLITAGPGGISTGARRWEERIVDDLKRRRDGMLTELRDLQLSKKRSMGEETLQSELLGFDSKLTFSREDLNATKRKLISIREELVMVQGQLSEVQPRAAQAAASLVNRQSTINRLQAAVNQTQDQVFADLCRKTGIANIREYEELTLKRALEVSEECAKYETQLSKLRNQLQLEELQLTETTERMTRLDTLLAADTKLLDDYEMQRDILISRREELEQQLVSLKADLTEAQAEHERRSLVVNTQRKQMATSNKHLDSLTKDIGAKESLAEKLNSERSSIFRKCKLERIELPLLRGSLDDVSMDDVDTHRPNPYTPSANDNDMDVDDDMEAGSSQSQGRASQQVVRSQDWPILVDFDDLSEQERQSYVVASLSSSGPSQEMQRLSLLQSQPTSGVDMTRGRPSAEQVENEYLDKLKKLGDDIERIAPNLKASDRLDGVEARLKQTDKEFDAARKSARSIKELFGTVRQERYDRFTKAFQHISEQIDPIYKELTKSTAFPMGGTAYLSMEDSEEPYLDGIRYHAMPPLKRFRDMDQLSGGEKTMAALALLFAIHSYRPSPFFVLDEVDAALDNMNVSRLGNYLQSRASDKLQFIVISLKSQLYERGQGLVGIYRDQLINSSQVLTLDLNKYEE